MKCVEMCGARFDGRGHVAGYCFSYRVLGLLWVGTRKYEMVQESWADENSSAWADRRREDNDASQVEELRRVEAS